MTQNINSFRIILVVLLLISFLEPLKAENLKELIDLTGTWKFTVGDNPEWSKIDYDHKNWDELYVPKSWEDNGYKDYNGYAWYRKEFYLNSKTNDEFVYLLLGYIDDADEVYLNGKLIGVTGVMGTNVVTAYTIKRKYLVPSNLLNTDSKNTIAVRVYDFYYEGGILGDKIGIYRDADEDLLELNLAGYWNFETEQELKARLNKETSKDISRVFVPGYWESNGYCDYNGKTRYQTTFDVPQNLPDDDLYMVLGFIDDIETVYLNGEKIGSVIAYEKEEKTKLPYYKIFRGYKIPKELLNTANKNILSVLVYDKVGPGGIYGGPIGIATKDNFEELKHNNTRQANRWELFFGNSW